ncbi:MAG: ribosomal protein S18-alanine N-acetyltransferase [Candidatus Krumholzibacteria bacterium]|nr:ribosomal protein S18-alanine N-acetyltransferase [Candidatus Krumholzibacteria bacterium]
MTENRVREMETRDIPRVMEIERSSFATPWTEGMFRSQIGFKDETINLVLADGEELAAYAAAWIAYDEIHLLSIAVAPSRRRRGLGTEILREAIARGVARGAVRVILEVREGNAPARAFYEKHGFVEIGKRRRYYSDTGEDAIVMEYVCGF